MADTCVPTPTQTRTDVGTSQSQTTTFSVSTSTAPGSVETTVFRTCSVNAPPGNTSTCVPTVTTSFITHPGNTSVVTVPVTVPVDYPVTNIVTLWGSSCSSIYSPPPVTSPSDTSTSTSWSIYTPPPSLITSSSTITSDGSTFVDVFTSTSTSAPTSVPVQQTGAADNSGAHHKKSNNVGPIVGGVAGGIVALLLLGFITWKLINKQPRFDDIFNNDQYHNKVSKDPDPKPYSYDPVGQQATDPSTMSPQMNTQGADPGQGFNDIGPQPSQAPPHHLRNPSLTPLLAAVGVAAASAGAASLSTSSRPSTTDSQPVGPAAGQGQGAAYPPSSFPPALQNWGPNQGYGAANTQAGYNAPGGAGGASGSGQASGSVPSSSLVPNTSIGSTGSGPSTTTSSWGAGSSSSGTGPLFNPPIVPIIAGTVRNNRPQQQQYEDPFNRTGSPVSIHEQRILQVTNAEPRGSIYDPNAYYAEGSSSSSGAAAAGAPIAGGIYDPNAYYAEGSSSSSSAAAGAGTRPSALAGGASSSSSAFPMDGKGRRPLNTTGEKMPLVHLDGGLYQQPVPGVQTGPAPPAYTE